MGSRSSNFDFCRKETACCSYCGLVNSGVSEKSALRKTTYSSLWDERSVRGELLVKTSFLQPNVFSLFKLCKLSRSSKSSSVIELVFSKRHWNSSAGI